MPDYWEAELGLFYALGVEVGHYNMISRSIQPLERGVRPPGSQLCFLLSEGTRGHLYPVALFWTAPYSDHLYLAIVIMTLLSMTSIEKFSVMTRDRARITVAIPSSLVICTPWTWAGLVL